jgi:hypothetical protein
MPTICIQCSMRAMLTGDPAPIFEEEPEAHRTRVHPDLVETQRERRELERALAVKLATQVKKQ